MFNFPLAKPRNNARLPDTANSDENPTFGCFY